MAAGLGWWLIREGFRSRTLIAATFSLLGIIIIMAGGLGTGNMLGDAIVLVMTLGNALYIVLIRVFRGTSVVWAGGVSALQLFAASWLVVDPLSIARQDAILLLLFGICFAVAIILWTEGTKRIPAAESGLLGTSEIPFAVLLAWVMLAEVPPLASFLGGGIVLVAAFVHAVLDTRDA
jgi:drug/metabolite transporter (DMT)-like permease